MATLGGARVLGRDDIGALAPGMAADVAIFPLDTPGLAGALDDPLGALLLCHVPAARDVVVGGRVLLRHGELQTLELPRLIARHNQMARQLREAA